MKQSVPHESRLRILRILLFLLIGFCFISNNVAQAQTTNLAAGGTPTQSSTESQYGAVAGRAIDGNTSGHWPDGSVTHTTLEFQPWWEVNLNSPAAINTIQVWNRTDCCRERLGDFYVFVSDTPFATDLNTALSQGVWNVHIPGTAGTPTGIPVGRTGRYVRIQLTGTNPLSLAEVQVLGTVGGNPAPTVTLSYLGKVQDKVGPGEQRLGPDTLPDGTFQVGLGSGARTVTRLELRRTDAVGIWDTIGTNGYWSLGASSTLGGALANSANDAVNFPVPDGGSFYLYAADFINAAYPNGLLLPGFTFALSASFADGTTATAQATVGAGGTAPTITSPPQNATVTAPASATFSVTATGTPPLSYQWQKNAVDIPNATTATYTTPATTVQDSGTSYRVIVSNAAGPTTSNPVTLTVNSGSAAPSIALSYEGTLRDKVGRANLALTGDTAPDATLTLTLVPGSGARTLTKLDLRSSTGGIWDTVAATDYWTLGVTAGLDTGLLNNADASISVLLTEGVGVKLFAADPATSILPTETVLMLTATFSDGTSAAAQATVGAAGTAPTITSPPQSATVTTPASATFSVTATGTPPLSYQWQKNAVDIPNATTASYTTPATTVQDSGTSYRVIVNNAAGPTTSNTVTLTVNSGSTAPSIALSYEGTLRDKVGRANLALTGDTAPDATLTLTLVPGSGARTLTRLELRSSTGGIWDTLSATPYWALGLAAGLDTGLLNNADASISVLLTEGVGVKLFAADPATSILPTETVLMLTATFSDGTSAAAQATVGAAGTAPTLSSVTVNPPSVVGGISSTGTVILTGPAPTGGALVTLASLDPSAASVPGSLTVPEGETSRTFAVTTSVVSSVKNVTITASYGGVNQPATLTVNPASSGPQEINYLYDELNRLIAVVDPTAGTAIYQYDPVGNLLTIRRQGAGVVSIIDFSPKSGPVGTLVTISGTGLGSLPAENTVTFNGLPATVVSAPQAGTQLVVLAPTGGTGIITVTSPAGGPANSSTPFTVTVGGGDGSPPTIINFNPKIGTPGTAVTIDGTNFDPTVLGNRVTFNLAQTQVSSATLNSITTTVPTTAHSGPITVWTPTGKAISSADFFVPPSPYTALDVQYTGRLAIDGPPHTATITTANKIALITFDGIRGKNVSLGINAISGGKGLRVLTPDGSSLLNYCCTAAGSDWHWSLPATGTYTIIYVPGTVSGSSITLSVSSEVNAGTVAIDGPPKSATVTRAGQRARMTFTVSSAQVVSLGVNAISGGTGLTVLNPNGSELVNYCCAAAGSDWYWSLAAGTYTILYTPGTVSGGSITLSVSSEVNAGTVLIDGLPKSATVTRAGQRARMTFTVSSAQVVGLGVNAISGGTGLTVLNPNGSELLNYCCVGTGSDWYWSLAAGTYTILYTPGTVSGGSITLSVSSEVNAGTVLIDGLPKSATVTRAGQRARMTFTVSSAQVVSLGVNAISGGTGLTVLNPNGSELQNYCCAAAGSDLHWNLAAGTYTILYTPGTVSGGSITLSVSSEVNAGTVVIDGPPKSATVTRAGQRARMTFTVSSAQVVSLGVNAVSGGTGLTVLNPNGSPLLNTCCAAAGKNWPWSLAAGTYTILYTPGTVSGGSITLRLYSGG